MLPIKVEVPTGLESKKAKQVSDMFKPMMAKMEEFEEEYNHIASLPVAPETCALAKELRLKYVKVRTGTDAIHKELKQFYLLGGRFVDGWRNAQRMASEGAESNLMAIEKHYETIEIERIAKLQEKRAKEYLKYYDVDTSEVPKGLGEMDDNVWSNFIAGAKLAHEKIKEAEEKTSKDEEKRQREEAVHNNRIASLRPLWQYLHEDLHEENFGSWVQKDFEALQSELLKAKKKDEDEQERIRLENKRLKDEADKKVKDDEIMRIKQEKEDKIKEDRQLKLEKELQDKKDEEAKRLKDEEDAIQVELAKGDAAKIKDLTSDLLALKTAYVFKSKKNKSRYVGVGQLLDKVVAYIVEN